MSMRWTFCLISILFYGCQGVSVLEWPTEDALTFIMPLWDRYQQCLTSTNPEKLALVIDQFERVTHLDIEPPSWMRSWGEHVMGQPVRTAVDPQALGAACTLRVAALLVEGERLREARVLYQRILARYSGCDCVYYVEKARDALKSLSGSVPTAFAPVVLAQRANRALSH
jgi:hypothetical protein